MLASLGEVKRPLFRGIVFIRNYYCCNVLSALAWRHTRFSHSNVLTSLYHSTTPLGEAEGEGEGGSIWVGEKQYCGLLH